MINIARPLELPPLKLANDSPATDAKKKAALPLFGKKRTFGFGKPTAAPTKPAPKPIIIDDDSSQKRNVEEFDDDDDDVGDNKTNEATSESSARMENNEVPLSSPGEHKTISVNKNERQKDAEIDEPAQSSNRSSSGSSKVVTDESVGKLPTSVHDEHHETQAQQPDENTVTDKTSSKRKRIRYRNRGDKGRDNIDMDDIEEPLESDKYSKWMPPENQSGDGITDLNSKYGY